MKRQMMCSLTLMLLMLSPAARAGTKEEIMRVQSDVLQMQNQIREFEKAFNEKNEGLKSLVVQLNDQVAKSNLLLDRISKILENQSAGAQSVNQTLLQEIRNLSLKMDDTGTRLSALAQQVNDLKVQAKPLVQGGTSSSIPPEETMYNQAKDDYVQGNFDLAVQGFSAYLSSYPGGARAADAQFYLGDAYSAQNKLGEAVIAFSRVINDYPGTDKIASALYKRAMAELALQETDNAIADFRDVIEKYPESPEAEQARSQLRNLGVSPKKQAPVRGTRRR